MTAKETAAILNRLGGTAFPVTFGDEEGNQVFVGMSLRDWFAGQALTAMIVSGPDFSSNNSPPTLIAEWAYYVADAMIAESDK